VLDELGTDQGRVGGFFSSDAFTRYRIEGIELRPSSGELLDKIEQVFEQPLRVEKQDTGVKALFREELSQMTGLQPS